MAFTADGDPLVLGEHELNLRPAWMAAPGGFTFERLSARALPVTGPFTPAPARMVAVFDDGNRAPVVFYDVHGRAVLVGEDAARGLVLATEVEGLVRIEGGPHTVDAEGGQLDP